MFDTSLVRAHAIAGPRRSTLFVSVAIHTIVIAGAFALTIASAQLPADPPRQLELYRAMELPAPPPPPRGVPRHEAGRQATPPTKPRMAPAPQPVTAPETIPQTIPIDPGPVSTSTATTTGGPIGHGPVGTETGVDGGVGDPDAIGERSSAPMPYTPGAGGVVSARVIRRVEPRFPTAFAGGVRNAIVVVRCVIDKNGDIRDPEIIRSSFPPFNDAVINAIRQWKFAAGTMHGQPVDTWFELTVKFQVIR